MKLYTSQYGYRGEDRVDTTVKTSDKLFSPNWDMVMRHKSGKLSDEEYTQRYYAIMRKSYIENKNKWNEFLSRDHATIVCFCKAGKFCHRLLLADILTKLGAEYVGEVDTKGNLIEHKKSIKIGE